MADIARVAGVAKITVSRALSEGSVVNPETRARVREVAQQLGYRMNVAARNLRLQRTHTVAVAIELAPSVERPMSDPYPLALLGGIIEELTSADCGLSLITVESMMRSPPAADGIILLGQGMHDDAVAEISRLELPFVVWGAVHEPLAVVTVGSNNVEGGRMAAQQLADQGRSRVVFVGDVEYAEASQRQEGFAQEATAHGLSVLPTIAASFTFSAGEAAVEALFDSATDLPDGIFCASDTIAMGVIKALARHGVAVPEQTSVIGFDDCPAAALHVPPLTSVHQDWNLGGHLLARKALALIADLPVFSEQMPTRLVVRST